MAKSKILSYLLLYPVSKIYAGVMAIRNAMFERGMLKQTSFDIPVIVVGNISMGGSGKTPHTEYIVNALKSQYRIGVLSRGYKRKTRGFVLATPDSHVADIGDELPSTSFIFILPVASSFSHVSFTIFTPVRLPVLSFKNSFTVDS